MTMLVKRGFAATDTTSKADDRMTGDEMPDTATLLASVAAEAGVQDILVFRRLDGRRWAHLGGAGRGSGWAGIVEVDENIEPVLTAALDAREPLRVHGPEARRVIGPYWARAAALVRVDSDQLVVFGASPTMLDDRGLRAAAHRAVDLVGEVSPAKRLGDELEVLTAVRHMVAGLSRTLPETLDHVVATAASALSCEVAVLRTRAGFRAVAAPGFLLEVSDVRLAAALDAAARHADGNAVCVQDPSAGVLPEPLSPQDGVLSWYALPLPEPVGGILVVAHTQTAPRGFTGLCQQLGQQLAESAAVVIHTAELRHALQVEAQRFADEARRDPLTGVGNRLAWDEALAAEQVHADSGRSCALMVVDLDGLKEVNDTCGHAAGDALIARCARLVTQTVRVGDVVARLGGDEFAVLLRSCEPAVADEVADRLRLLLHADDQPVAASVGLATTADSGDLRAALSVADTRMYAEKQARRTAVRN